MKARHLHRRGPRALQPAANKVVSGTLYAITDEDNRIERSNGVTWDGFHFNSPFGSSEPHGHPTSDIEGLDVQLSLYDQTLAEIDDALGFRVPLDDVRLTNTRDPNPHAHEQYDVNGLEQALDLKINFNDSRLSDARTPTAHTHPQSDITNLVTDLSNKVNNNDSRLTDSRTPLSHTHVVADITNLPPSSSPVFSNLAAGVTLCNFGTNTTVKLTPNANLTLTTTVPPAGHTRYLIILTSGTTSRIITFGTGFKATATLATGTVTARVFVVHWISDGTSLYEAGRTVAMVA